MSRISGIATLILTAIFAISPVVQAAPRKAHTVVLGAVKKVPYSKAGDPAGAAPGPDADIGTLKIRALLVDGALKEWTTGDAHDVTGRSFVVRRAIRLNDTLPGDKQEHWVWQRGPWLLVDRVAGHVTALKLPDYDPGVSQVSWFRDYAAYCGLAANGKSLYAVVAQVAARKPVLARKIAAFDAAGQSAPSAPSAASAPPAPAAPACAPPDWQREPLRITFHPAGKDAMSYDFVPGSAVLVEGASDEDETQESAAPK